MTTLAVHREVSQAIVLPEPRGGAIGIRIGTEADLQFIDQLQKQHSRMVGFMKLPVLRGNIKHGRVLIAEQFGERVGYCIANDKYLKREELGICYQLNVVPTNQRGFIGASLIKAVFDRAAYGCKLFCCWCAQDLEANRFWESLGFVPLAFRTGSRVAGSKRTPRIHIFWQRRIRENDAETPYWFPSETSGGALKENRLVLPIPPGTRWSDAKPSVLPGMEGVNVLPPGVADPDAKKARVAAPKTKTAKPSARPKRGLWFTPAQGSAEAKAVEKPAKPKREKFTHDPKLVEAARELRDRYIEQINAGLLLPPSGCGKYDVSRQLEAAPSTLKQTPLLKAA